ncbi:MAG: alpha/beta fold hydrolase [Alphaproteobacteria bacterium]|nr:alpha/beta fold hydrolase [Alphaproteobacteria bacterium]
MLALLLHGPAAAQVGVRLADAPAGTEQAFGTFLLEPFHRAFAVGPNGRVGVASAADSDADAIAQALQHCGEGCRVIAVGDRLDDQPRPPPPPIALGPVRSDPDYPLRAPAAATGVVIWNHGSGPDPSQIARYPDAWMRHLFADGWDIAVFDRSRAEDQLTVGRDRLVEAIAHLRGHGYRRVVLAGHSRGAWLALLAATAAELAPDAVIALAPAIHGTNRPGNVRFQQALPQWLELVAALPPRVGLALVTFRADPFDPDPQARAAAAASPRCHAFLLPEPPWSEGHGGGMDLGFARAFGPLITQFLRDTHAAHCGDRGQR